MAYSQASSPRLPGLPVKKDGRYRLSKRELDLPDVLMRRGDGLAAVFECQARTMGNEDSNLE